MIIWSIPAEEVCYAAISDAAGQTGLDGDAGAGEESADDVIDRLGSQAAWMMVASNCQLAEGKSTRVIPMAWRLAKLKRVVVSTLAGETQPLGQAIAELEWNPIIHRELLDGEVQVPEWFNREVKYSILLKRDCGLMNNQPSIAAVNAKSLFDTLLKSSAGSRQDQRNAMDVAVVRQSLQHARTQVRWVPCPRMLVDIMTKSAVSKGNNALSHMLKTGQLCLIDEEAEMLERKETGVSPGCSKAASIRIFGKAPEVHVNLDEL
jgi:hypothetical protein